MNNYQFGLNGYQTKINVPQLTIGTFTINHRFWTRKKLQHVWMQNSIYCLKENSRNIPSAKFLFLKQAKFKLPINKFFFLTHKQSSKQTRSKQPGKGCTGEEFRIRLSMVQFHCHTHFVHQFPPPLPPPQKYSTETHFFGGGVGGIQNGKVKPNNLIEKRDK